jgi:hypothetical protein
MDKVQRKKIMSVRYIVYRLSNILCTYILYFTTEQKYFVRLCKFGDQLRVAVCLCVTDDNSAKAYVHTVIDMNIGERLLKILNISHTAA